MFTADDPPSYGRMNGEQQQPPQGAGVQLHQDMKGQQKPVEPGIARNKISSNS